MSFPISAGSPSNRGSFNPRPSQDSSNQGSSESETSKSEASNNGNQEPGTSNQPNNSTPNARQAANSPLFGSDRSGFQPIEISGDDSSSDGSGTEGEGEEKSDAGDPTSESILSGDSKDAEGLDGEELSRREKQKVEKLERKDQKVRKHEQAHLSAGGRYVRGGVEYEYKRGPDGERYAVGGSVSLDAGRANSPEKTIQKMRQVRAAALAPAQPSPKDLQVAQSASKKAADARQELSEEQRKEIQETQEKIKEETSSDSDESGESSDGQAESRQIPVTGQSNADRTRERDSAGNQSSQRSRIQDKPESFRDPGEDPVSPEIKKSSRSEGPGIEKLEGTDTVELEEREQVSAPEDAFEDVVNVSGKKNVTLGENFEATA